MTTDVPTPDDQRWIRVDGARLVDAAGATVRLTGYGLGGWMNMENFITGYPSSEQQQRKALRRVMGEDAYEAFFERFLTDFFAEADAAYVASLGMNCMRVPFNYRHFEDDDRPFELKEDGFRWLDRVVRLCADAGVYTILDLHAAQGYQNQHWHSDNPTHWSDLWNQRQFQDRVVHLWEALADRYKDQPWVAGYNPLNEPADATGQAIIPLYERLEQAIRAIDPRHVLFLDGNRYSTDFSMFTEPFDQTVYTAHDYALPGIARDGVYPGETRGERFDRGTLEAKFLERTEFMRSTGTPIWIGEFAPQYLGDPAIDAQRYQLLRDQLEIYAEHGASWSAWTYKDIGLQGVVYAAPDSPYVETIRPVLEKKERLGTDSWGGTDEHIRHILDPIEELFAKEFPDYEPYPWDQRKWVHTLVRHILLAEPLVADFARCFEGVTPGRAEELAASFAFEACIQRDELARLLGDHHGVSS